VVEDEYDKEEYDEEDKYDPEEGFDPVNALEATQPTVLRLLLQSTKISSLPTPKQLFSRVICIHGSGLDKDTCLPL
jgi:hypothetical protein